MGAESFVFRPELFGDSPCLSQNLYAWRFLGVISIRHRGYFAFTCVMQEMPEIQIGEVEQVPRVCFLEHDLFPTSQQASKQASERASKQASKQASERASKQESKQAVCFFQVPKTNPA